MLATTMAHLGLFIVKNPFPQFILQKRGIAYYLVVPTVVGTTSSCDMTNLRLQVDGADNKG